MTQPTSVTLMGRTFGVSKPDFATAEELLQQLVVADREMGQAGGTARVLRVRAAILGVCSQVGDLANASWTRARCDALVYGGQVYSWLREQGATPDEVVEQSTPLVGWLLQATFPRAGEVQEKRDFS